MVPVFLLERLMSLKETILFETTNVDLESAAQLIKEGKIVIFPTETVYGLGANALNEDRTNTYVVNF